MKTRKKYYFLLLIFIIGCEQGNKELYKITDSYVKSLENREDYGLFGWLTYQRNTSDGQYQVTPFGRLINVKIMKPVAEEVYTKLMQDLKSHYKGDTRVNDVYINNLGTLIIDCRK
jgi:hypothetical protein